MPVFEVCVLAVYDLPSMYSLLQNFANEKENYNFIHEKAATNIQLLKCIQFLFDNM